MDCFVNFYLFTPTSRHRFSVPDEFIVRNVFYTLFIYYLNPGRARNLKKIQRGVVVIFVRGFFIYQSRRGKAADALFFRVRIRTSCARARARARLLCACRRREELVSRHRLDDIFRGSDDTSSSSSDTDLTSRFSDRDGRRVNRKLRRDRERAR